MESYLKYTLGLHVLIRRWDDSKTLPDELRKERDYSLLEICGVVCLVITIRTQDFQMSVFEREREALRGYCEYPFVLCFERITSYQRKCLIESGQSFIVPDNQLYMPFLGIALQEHFKALPAAGAQLTAMAQYILLFFLYETESGYHSKLELSQYLGISLMNVSRGVQELEELGLVQTKKKGRSSMVTAACSGKELYERAREYLRSPIQRRFYAKQEDWLLELPIAGRQAAYETGLTHERSDYPVRAIEKRAYLDCAERITALDPAWDTQTPCVEIEVWRYDPVRFGNAHKVDSFSLALSLGESDGAADLDIDKLLTAP